MTRLLLIASLALLLWLGLERLAGRRRGWGGAAARRGRSGPPPRARHLLRCEACGVHFAPEGTAGRGAAYCSEECRSRARA